MTTLSYWLELRPGPVGALWPLYAALAVAFAAVTASGALRGRGWTGRVQVLLGASGLLLVVARFAQWPVLSMRALAPAALAAAVAAPLLAPIWRDLAGRSLDALAFALDPADRPLPARATLILVAVYGAILFAAGRLHGQPLWYAPALLGLLLAPQLLPWGRLRGPRLEALAPLLWTGALIGLRVISALLVRAGVVAAELCAPSGAGCFGVFFDVPSAVRFSATYAALVTGILVLRAYRREAWAPALGTGILALALAGWAGTAYLTRHTSGATGTDPFAYTLMAVDLARTGQPLHAFPLVHVADELGLPWQPAVHLGYRLPIDAAGHAPTVWPPGHAALLALGYLLLGEAGLYATTPVIALLAAAAAAALAWMLYPSGLPGALRPLAAVLAAGLIATSPEQIVRALVPMADASATLFSALALGLAWIATRPRPEVGPAGPGPAVRLPLTARDSVRGRAEPSAAATVAASSARPRRGTAGAAHPARPWAGYLAAAAGLGLGLAYDMRYTQVLLALSFVLLGLRLPGWRARLRFYALAGAAAAAAALPDLWYHQLAFGGPFQTGSEELRHFAPVNVWPMAQAMWAELSLPGEITWPWLWLLAAAGAAVLWRAHGRWLLALLSGPALVIALHLFYGYLRLRDLLPQYPLVAVFVAVGAAGTLAWTASATALRAPRARGLAVAAVLIAIAVAVAARTEPALGMPFSPGFSTFGYLQPAQRASFDRLAERTPPDAVVAATLNSGPVELYAKRLAFRPGDWDVTQGLVFVEGLLARGRPVYVLDDGVALQPLRERLRAQGRLVEVERLPLPYFYPGGGSLNQDVILYQVVAHDR